MFYAGGVLDHMHDFTVMRRLQKSLLVCGLLPKGEGVLSLAVSTSTAGAGGAMLDLLTWRQRCSADRSTCAGLEHAIPLTKRLG